MSLKKIAQAVSLAFCISFSAIPAYAATPQSVIPAHARADKISTPASVLGFELGEWHARPEQSWSGLARQSGPQLELSWRHHRRTWKVP